MTNFRAGVVALSILAGLSAVSTSSFASSAIGGDNETGWQNQENSPGCVRTFQNQFCLGWNSNRGMDNNGRPIRVNGSMNNYQDDSDDMDGNRDQNQSSRSIQSSN